MTASAGFQAKLRALAGRLDPFPDPGRPLFRPTPAELAVWLVFALLTLLMVRYHEPWRDEAQGFLIVRDTTLPKLILHMKYESQFLLWFLLTWPLVRLCGMSIFGVNLVHWALSCGTAFLILRRAPFRLLTRAALIFTVLFAFEFTVVTRHYAIGVFLLAVLMVNWRQRFRHPVLYACGIALCASTSLPVWVCLGGLCAAIGCEVVSRRLWTRPVFAAMLVVLFGFALALAEIYNGQGGFGSPYVSRRGTQVAELEVMKRFQDAFDALSNLAHLPVWLCLVCFLAGALYFAWKSVPALTCFLTSAFLMISLQFVGGFHSMRHTGFLLLGTVISCWIAALEDAPPAGFLSRMPKRAVVCVAAAAGCSAAILLFLQAVLTPFFVWMEVRYPFSHGHAAADFIRDNIPGDVPLFCFSARSNTSVMPWLPRRQFYIFDRKEMGTYSKWGNSQGLPLESMAIEAASRLEPGQRYGIFVIALNEQPIPFTPPNMILLYDSRENELPVWGPYIEAFQVFAVVRQEDQGLYRPRFQNGPRTSFGPDGM